MSKGRLATDVLPLNAQTSKLSSDAEPESKSCFELLFSALLHEPQDCDIPQICKAKQGHSPTVVAASRLLYFLFFALTCSLPSALPFKATVSARLRKETRQYSVHRQLMVSVGD